MQLTDTFCYALLTITMAAACAHAERYVNDVEERDLDRRMNRRTATVIIEAAPVERMFQKPKVVYRKVSKKRHAPPRSTYGPPRPKYGPPRKPLRKPGKKYRNKVNHKHVTPSYKKRSPKPRYGPPNQPPTMKPVYGPPKKSPHSPYHQDNTGFGEPPTSFSTKPRPTKPRPNFNGYPSKPDFSNDFSSKPNFGDDFSSKPIEEFSSPASLSDELLNIHFGNNFPKSEYSAFPKQSYGEPPVDSYGAPIKPNLRDLTYSTAHSPDSTSHDSEYTFENNPPWKNYKDKNLDSNSAYSNMYSAFSKPEPNDFITSIPENHKEELHMNSYSDIYNFRQTNKNKKKKKASYHENVKIINQPWKGGKIKEESDDEIIVGGQYAEPPGRYVPNFQPSAQMHDNDDSAFSPVYNVPDPDSLTSATISSYVNYKNSNLAFSPQNLNDAFSIVDK